LTLFDIAADNVMTSEEDKKFLQMQRENPTSCSMSGCDKVLAAIESRKRKRSDVEEKRKEKQTKLTNICCSSRQVHCSSGSEEDSSTNDPGYICQLSSTISRASNQKNVSRTARQIMNTDVVATLDRAKINDRSATFVIASVVQGLGANLGNAVLEKYVTKRRMSFFDVLAENGQEKASSFLDKPPSSWLANPDCCQLKLAVEAGE